MKAGAESEHLSDGMPLVLVVEDNHDVRRTTQRLLEIWGYRADGAEDGHIGVAQAISLRPAVALIDLGLPGLDGYEVARQIRATLGRSIHLVALTGYGDEDHVSRAREAGFDLHLLKPVMPDKLSRTLSDLLAGGLTHPE